MQEQENANLQYNKGTVVTHKIATHDEKWETFIVDIGNSKCKLAMQKLWSFLKTENSKIATPSAGPIDYETDVYGCQFVWDSGRFHLEIEMNEDGNLEWFYMDRESKDNAIEYGEENGFSIPKQLQFHIEGIALKT